MERQIRVGHNAQPTTHAERASFLSQSPASALLDLLAPRMTAEIERDLDREQLGLAAVRARTVHLGRLASCRISGICPTRFAAEWLSYRQIGRNLGLSKNTVMNMVNREDALA
jgi:hypothetical protein